MELEHLEDLTHFFGDVGKAAAVKFKVVGDNKRLKYDKNVLLGSGSTGTRVYIGAFRKEITESEELVAIKRVMYDTPDENKKALNEIKSLQQLRHTNIVRYIYADRIDEHDMMFIALELCRGSFVNLFSHKLDVFERPFLLRNGVFCDDWWFKKYILRGFTVGLDYVHSQGFIHRDLKPQNILVCNNDSQYGLKAVICDFEFTKKLQDGLSKMSVSQVAVGTQGWMPKEVLQARNMNQKIKLTKAVDIFAYGCIVHYVLSESRDVQHIHPYGSDMHRDTSIMWDKRYSYISLNLKADSESNISFDSEVDDDHFGDAILADMLIGECISGKKGVRPPASELLQHPFFWDYSSRINCCETMFNTFKHGFQKNDLIVSMETTWRMLVPSNFFPQYVPECWHYYTIQRSSVKRKIPGSHITSTLFNFLMRFIRNLQQHYYEAISLHNQLQDVIPSGDEEILGKYFFERIPMSFPVIYMFYRQYKKINEESTDREKKVHKLLLRTIFAIHNKKHTRSVLAISTVAEA